MGAERLVKRKRVVAWTKMETVERERTDPYILVQATGWMLASLMDMWDIGGILWNIEPSGSGV